MRLRNIIERTWDIIGHVVTAGLTVDTVRNIYNGISIGNDGYYQLAIVEAVVAAYIQVTKKSGRDRKRIINNILILADEAEELRNYTHEKFRNLINKLGRINKRKKQEIFFPNSDLTYFTNKRKIIPYNLCDLVSETGLYH